MTFFRKVIDIWKANIEQHPRSLSVMFGILFIATLILLGQTIQVGIAIGIWNWSNFLYNLTWYLTSFATAFVSVMTGVDMKAYQNNHNGDAQLAVTE